MAPAVVQPTAATRPANLLGNGANGTDATGRPAASCLPHRLAGGAGAPRSWSRGWARGKGANALAPLRRVHAQSRRGDASGQKATTERDHHGCVKNGVAVRRTRRGECVVTRASTADVPEPELERVPVSITGQKSLGLWTCLAVAATLYSVPFGFVRWNLSTIAPLVWWQMAASTAMGTVFALPFLLAIANPAVAYRLDFGRLARVAFGVKGAALVSFSRGILGAALAALTTLIGGEAAYGLWGELSYMFFDGAPLPAEARAIAYGAFWLVQTLVAGGKSAGAKVLNLGRVAALVVGAYFFWSWNAGDASTVWEATMATMPSLSSPSAFVPSVPAEFWKHALMTTGVWMTLGSVLPDYAQRMSSAGRVAKGQIAWLPLLTACTALVASSMAQAPNLALYAVVATAALVTNATANFVGPMTALGGSSPGMGAAFAVSCAIACAAPLVMTWQQTVAAASWAVGVGSLLVAPVAGVMLADYWIMRGRVVDRSQLDANTGPGGVYHYLGGVNLRAVAAFLVGVAPDLISVARGASSLFGGSVSAAAMGADAFLSAYVVNMEYSSMIGFAVSFMAYLLFSVLFTPDSLKIARAEARRMRDEDDALAKELAAAKADPYVDGPSVTKYANAVASTASMATAGGSPKKNGGNREVNAEPAMMAVTSAVATEEPVTKAGATATPTFFVRGKKSAKNEFIVNSPTNSGGRPEPPDSDGDDVDDEAILTFYRAAADRVDAALRPAMASRADARNNLRMLAKERQIMLEGHVENKLVMSMQEVRYEVMQMNLLIAEAELAAAEIEQDLAEARAFFEAEVEDDVEEIEARLDRDPGTGRLADAVQEAVAERRARFATARRDAVDASGAARDAVAATRNAGEQADNAANELRAEDETRSLLRNWAVAVGTWELPPILDVPMLPMSDEEAAQRSKEDLRRSEYESKVRAERENESIRRREEDARRAAAEADIRRAEEEERRIQSREEERRRSAADEVQRLEALIQSVTDSLQTTKSSMSNTVNLRRAEEDANVEREDQRRDLAAADKARAQTEIKAAEEREAARRAEFERKVDTSAAQEKLRRAEELERREAWDAETAALEEEETKKRADEDAGREASLRKVYAARDNLAVVVDGISRRRSDALLAMRELMEEEARLRAEEDARRAAAERVINQAALDERGVLTAQEDERRSAENLRRMQAADAARERAALEQAKIAEEDARRGDADDAVRAAADDLEALERDVKARRANAENDAEARRRALVDMRESERRRRAVIEQDMAIAAESEARARAEEDARKQAADRRTRADGGDQRGFTRIGGEATVRVQGGDGSNHPGEPAHFKRGGEAPSRRHRVDEASSRGGGPAGQVRG